MTFDRNAGIDTAWELKSEEEKYAEWSRYAEDLAPMLTHTATLTYVQYCNRWDKQYGVANGR